ncbi:MAG: FecR domain-containing protein [Accumulibacter sp.]|uniref:FecR family protein n=1 Tax=Accumulibacter sp. TaxID=2053492 RepID=UPI002FC297D1
MRKYTFVFLLLVALGVAAETGIPVGKVKRSEGNVTVDHAGQVQTVKVGTLVYVGDRIRTGDDGAVGITLSDDTLLTAGARSTLLINEYQFNSTTREGGMLLNLLKGTLSVVTGLIGKQAPENVRIRTPTVVLGIRGTEFIVEARTEDE